MTPEHAKLVRRGCRLFYDGLADAQAQIVQMLCDITREDPADVVKVWTSEGASFLVDGLARLTDEEAARRNSKGGRPNP